MSLFDPSWANPLPNVTLGIGRNRQHHGNIMAKHAKQLGHLGVLWLRWYSESSTLQAPSDSVLAGASLARSLLNPRCRDRFDFRFILDLLEVHFNASRETSSAFYPIFAPTHRGKSFSFLGCSLDSRGENIAERR